MVLGEYRYGIGQSRYPERYEQWLEDLIADCRVLDMTEATTHHYAAIHFELRQAGRPTRWRAQTLFESLTFVSRYMYRFATEIHQIRRF
jgi:predicted nucleic acid-binding protein